MKVSFTGGKALEAALMELKTKATARNVGKRALTVAAEPIRAEWERMAPRDSGDLKQSIKVGKAIAAFQKQSRGDQVFVFVGIDEGTNARLHIYAEVQEFGTPHTPAQPAGRPAWETKKMAAFDLIGPALWADLEKTAARAARKTAK